MDITPYFSGIIAAIIAAGGTYAAMAQRLSRLEAMIDDLRRDVEKHNDVVARTFKLESQQSAAWREIDKNRVDIRDLREQHVRDMGEVRDK